MLSLIFDGTAFPGLTIKLGAMVFNTLKILLILSLIAKLDLLNTSWGRIYFELWPTISKNVANISSTETHLVSLKDVFNRIRLHNSKKTSGYIRYKVRKCSASSFRTFCIYSFPNFVVGLLIGRWICEKYVVLEGESSHW